MTNTASPTSNRRGVRAPSRASKPVVRSIVAASVLAATATLAAQPVLAANAATQHPAPARVTQLAGGCSALCSHI